MTDSITTGLLENARAAAAAAEWRQAYDFFGEAEQKSPLSAEDLESAAWAADWANLADECRALRERAYAAYVAVGEKRRAASVALELARDYIHLLNESASSGWLARASRLLSEVPECPEHGVLARWRALRALEREDLDESIRQATLAFDIGVRTGDRNVQTIGLMQRGVALIHLGQTHDGMVMLDEAMAEALGGELDTITTAVVYCNVISACRNVADYKRAGEWTEAAKRWCQARSLTPFGGICRVYRAEIMRLRGAFAEAETEARVAVDELGSVMKDVAAAGLAELGDIRLRLGDLEAAEDFYRRANEWGHDPQPGLSLLRLEQGNLAGAAASIRRALSETTDRLAHARLLPAQVTIATAAGDLETARPAAEECAVIAADFGTTLLKASAACARGRVALAAGEPGEAVRLLRQAQRLWQEVDAPYETAECRLVLAAAYEAMGSNDDATLERAAATAVFRSLGVPDPAIPRVRLPSAPAASISAAREGRAFMFTDIVNSTPLLAAIGDDAWNDLLEWHDSLMQALVFEHNGEVVKHGGDGFFVAFPDVASGLSCASAIQRRLVEHRRSAGFAPQVRIGLHFAEATARDGDYFGVGVNQASRIGSAASAGEVLISETSLTGIDVPIKDRREVELKGIPAPVGVASVDWEAA